MRPIIRRSPAQAQIQRPAWQGLTAPGGCTTLAPRTVKIFELAFLRELTPLPSLALRLVFCTPLTHTQRHYRQYRLRGRGDGLETPARIYHGDGRSGTVVTQLIPGE